MDYTISVYQASLELSWNKANWLFEEVDLALKPQGRNILDCNGNRFLATNDFLTINTEICVV